jgi:aspartate/methionine/tyrosine aminotransferase
MPWGAAPNHFSRAIEKARTDGRTLLDLTTSNPTRAGFDYSQVELAEALKNAASAPYHPDPRGLRSARDAVAAALSSADDAVDPESLILTASTSEAYAFLFKLLGDPGDEVVTARPAYPLLEHIAALESLRLRHYALSLQARRVDGRRSTRWVSDLSDVAAAVNDRTRALIVVHPNNPTGHYLSESERDVLVDYAAERQLAIISDEVFHDFAIDPRADRAPSLGRVSRGLIFSLGGLSKSAALPHWKLGWIRLSGEEEQWRAARERLELISDSFLSLATPVQEALPQIFSLAGTMRQQITERLRTNLAALRNALASNEAIEVLAPEGGWSAVIRVPKVRSDETLAMELLESEGVIVQPGYFYDFDSDGFLVVSLLTRSEVFEKGAAALAHFFSRSF